MSRYSVQTKLSPEAAIEKAIAYFGEGGLGLEVTDRGERCANFKGGGGHIDIVACDDEEKTEVNLETREWDFHVRSFIGKIG
jgi:hypothetical protein